MKNTHTDLSVANVTPKEFVNLHEIPVPDYIRPKISFVAYQLRLINDRKAKIPIDPHTGLNASVSKSSTWGSYEQAVDRAKRLQDSGIGFVLTDKDRLIGYDFDNCIAEDGMIEPWVQQILDCRETYAEYSPSRRGIRMLAIGKIDKAIVNHSAGIEVYANNRYLTLTGNKITGAPNNVLEAPEILAVVRKRVQSFEINRKKTSISLRPASFSNDKETNVFRTVNDVALDCLSQWVPDLFPFARDTDQGYRVCSHDLNRDLEEDLSITRTGIKDWGVRDLGDTKEGSRTPIDLVIEYADLIELELDNSTVSKGPKDEKRLNGQNAYKAVKWLADRLDIDLFAMGLAKADSEVVLQALNEKYSVVTDGNRVRVLYFDNETFNERHRSVPKQMQFAEFERAFQNKYVTEKRIEERNNRSGELTQHVKEVRYRIGKWWLDHERRRQYEGIVLAPNKPEVVDGKINLWKGLGVKAQRGEFPFITQFITEVIASNNADHATYILRWLAYAVQHPERPAETALVLKGEKGTGKSTLNRMMLAIFGQHGLSVSNFNHLIGNFNGHLRDACFVAVEEAIWSGSKVGDGILKSLITDASLTVEAKGQDVVTVQNMLHIIVCTNELWAVNAGEGERRFGIFAVSNLRKGDKEFWDALNHEIDHGGLEAFLWDLLAMDLNGFHPRNVVHTEAEAAVQIQGLDGLDSYLRELLEVGVLPGSTSTDPAFCLVKDMADHIDETVPQFFLTRQKLAAYMQSVGVKTGVRRGSNARGCEFPPLSTMRADWDKKYPTMKWENPDVTEWIPSDLQPGHDMREAIRVTSTQFKQGR